MPNYFADYDTTVHFISEEELKSKSQWNPARRICTQKWCDRLGKRNKHLIEYSLKTGFQSGIYFSVILAYARAAYRLHKEGQTGCKTVFDIAPAYLSPKSAEELRAEML